MKKMVITAALFLAVVFVYAQEQRRLRFFYEDPEVIRLLEEYNARLWYRTYECPWHELLFAQAPFEAFQKLFALGVDTELEGIQRDRPLMGAISRRRDDVVELLLSHGADAHRANRRGVTPLVHAAASGNPRILELLINAGASTDVTRALLAVFTRGGTFYSYHAEKARILIDNGADVNAVTSDGWTPLLMAARTFLVNPEAFQVLLSAGADVNAVNAQGQSALILTAANPQNHPLTIEFLLEAGADARLRDNTGRTALEWFDMNQRINRHPIRRELWERTM